MAKKKIDFKKMLQQYEPQMKKTGEQIVKAAKKAEEEITKAYKVTQTHVEIQMGNLQKEKLYHEIGKEVAKKLMKGEIVDSALDKYKKKLEKLETEGDKNRKKLSHKSKAKKK